MTVLAREGPWLFDRKTDLWAFGGSALLAFALLGLGMLTGVLESDTPDVVWIGCVVAVDVAHVWSTIYRVYLDGSEVRRRPLLYLGAPVGCYALAVGVHALGARFFWTALAYMAVFHFVRQQAGWVKLYARREQASTFDRRLDQLTVYAATVVPILWWHAHLPRSFHWFLEGDFVSFEVGARVTEVMVSVHWFLLAFWGARQVQRWRQGEAPSLGKVVVIVTTWLCWHVGIVALNGDFAFTVTNVLIHGIPYLVLTYRYGQARRHAAPWIARILRGGAAAFAASVVFLAFAEEMLWDRFVWHDRPSLFGEGAVLSASALAVLVPLLALPQLVHYVLDGFIWRGPTNPHL
ncbi:MAG: hypothetical protein AAGE52_04495 [Myxococcota bacterium]